MVKVLIVSDGGPEEATKTMFYKVYAGQAWATVDSMQLEELTAEKLQGYDVIITDLAGKSVDNNQRFFDSLGSTRPSAIIMLSGSYQGKEDDLPSGLTIPAEVKSVITTHNTTSARDVIPAIIAGLNPGQNKNDGVTTSP